MFDSARLAGAAPVVPRVNPPPTYVVASEASDLISVKRGRKVHVAPAALTLLNEFLDHVLYSILCTSYSVSLGQLKAAVPVVLKPRLGKTALKVAEEELKDYIEEEEAEELYLDKNNLQPRTVFNADLVWKLTRLRCMVYARMGDLEEEDEEEWLGKEGLLDQAAVFSSASRSSMTMAAGAAIFLTSIIEYLGEQALYYAAQHAQKRHDTALRAENASGEPGAAISFRHSETLLEGRDMNHIGRDSPLSRLWRSWRRHTRSPPDISLRAVSFNEALSPLRMSVHSRATSTDLHQSSSSGIGQRRTSNRYTTTASCTSLSMSENDVPETDGHIPTTNDVHLEKTPRRPTSMPTMPGRSVEDASNAPHLTCELQARIFLRPDYEQGRSKSSSPDSSEDFQDMVQQTSSPGWQHLRIRADSDNYPTSTITNNLGKLRSLEHLIDSVETLRYTPMPATAEVREEETNSPFKRTQTQGHADFLRTTAPPDKENTTLLAVNSRTTGLNATRAPQALPVTGEPIPSSNDIIATTSLDSKSRNPQREPRDARIAIVGAWCT